ncbi:GntR family transcriptional regulator [Robbsia sp. Bb-Pol-6]|uniref:GntR family transcriptional regulator n=1 Tax=Robbsia betulipollinis TaxID=2981849 RepID=A0ABT3ZSN9_9BURK|nr:GntR family transcriptional regulator [Robbsia betulipollinis]MCY0389581.1 GntR family transcriptional regulator [Robbsia betulipollinis]
MTTKPAAPVTSRTRSVPRQSVAVAGGAAPETAVESRRRGNGRQPSLPDLLAQISGDAYEPIGRKIYRALRQAIFTGALAPGTPLSEKEVSEMCGISRQPVREAFIKLVEAGVLQVLPQRGSFVKKISARQVREGRFIREAIEVAVARKAAEVITPVQLAELDDNLRSQEVAAKAHDTTAFLTLDERFHYLIAKSIDCVAAWDAIQGIKAQMDRVRYLSLPDVSPLELMIEQHASIAAALRARDADGVEKSMRAHLREILTSLQPVADRNPDWFEMEASD